MKVFISWSGMRSRRIAEQLHHWLPYIIQPLRPFLSSGDIRKGVRWGDVLKQELHDTRYGIVCVTQQNMMSPWLNFEAGALSNKAGHASVSPVLFGVEPAKLTGPLSQFQTTAFAEGGKEMLELVSSINQNLSAELRVSPNILENTFRVWWPKLRQAVNSALEKETDETETGLRWLYSVADLATREGQSGWRSVMVINPDPLKDWHLLKETVLANLAKGGIEYVFIVPHPKVRGFKDLLQAEVPHRDAPVGGPGESKVILLSMDKEKYDRQAASHYRVLTPKGSKNPDTKVFFEIPVDPCGYWAEAKGESALNFQLRFNNMRDHAHMEVCLPFQPEGQGRPDAAAKAQG